MDTPQQPVVVVRRAHWGWFVACWLIVLALAATLSFTVLFIAAWGSFDSPNPDSDARSLMLIAAVVVLCGVLGAFMHRGLRHDASWPKYIIALAALSYPVRALYSLVPLFARILFR